MGWNRITSIHTHFKTYLSVFRIVIPGAVGEAEPGLVGEAEPDVVDEGGPVVVGEAKPGLEGESEPGVEGVGGPELVGEAEPGVVGEAGAEDVCDAVVTCGLAGPSGGKFTS